MLGHSSLGREALGRNAAEIVTAELATGAYTVSGVDVTVISGVTVALATGAYAITGSSVQDSQATQPGLMIVGTQGGRAYTRKNWNDAKFDKMRALDDIRDAAVAVETKKKSDVLAGLVARKAAKDARWNEMVAQAAMAGKQKSSAGAIDALRGMHAIHSALNVPNMSSMAAIMAHHAKMRQDAMDSDDEERSLEALLNG